VGAPHASNNAKFISNGAGRVYKCQFKGHCSELMVHAKGYKGELFDIFLERKSRSMLGSTLDVYDDTILVMKVEKL
jgi:hypothetical protein